MFHSLNQIIALAQTILSLPNVVPTDPWILVGKLLRPFMLSRTGFEMGSGLTTSTVSIAIFRSWPAITRAYSGNTRSIHTVCPSQFKLCSQVCVAYEEFGIL